MRRQRRTAEQWRVLIDQQHKSGLSAMAFCQQHELGYASFCNWRKRFAGDESADQIEPGDSRFVDVSSLVKDSQSASPGWHIVLSLGNGVELRLSQNG